MSDAPSSSRWQLLLRLLTLAALLVAAPLAILYATHNGQQSGLPVITSMGGDFVLDATTGKKFQLSQANGKVVLLTFGYTSCPNICPTNLARMARTLQQMGTDADKLVIVFVTIDPERDTVPHLARYVEFFDPRLIGATGTPAQIAAVNHQYGVVASRQNEADGSYSFDHSDYIYLLDTKGRLRKLYDSNVKSAEMTADVHSLLQEHSLISWMH